MNPGERVDLIKKVAASLASGEEFQRIDVDLIFDQFGFTKASFYGNPRPYVIDTVSTGSDDQLVELDRYLHPIEEQEHPAEEPDPRGEDIVDPLDPWERGGFRLFVSHCTSHADLAGKLRDSLADRGVDAFVAHETIEVTQEWEDVIRTGLKTCDAVLAILTPDFKDSDWTEQEVGFAIGRGKLIVSLRNGLDPHGFIARYQGLTVRGGDQIVDVARKIFEALVRHEETSERMAQVLVARFVKSWSYELVRANFAPLKLIPQEAWDRDLAQEVRSACESNNQIEKGEIDWTPAPEVVERLLGEVGFGEVS